MDNAFSWQAVPWDEGTATDSNMDGVGDWYMDGNTGHVFAGFNSFGPGEHRVVYEFSLDGAPKLQGRKAILSLNYTGSRYENIDPNLTLWAGAGDGLAGVDDFAAGQLVEGFYLFELPQPPPGYYEVHIDVTKVVRRLMNKGSGHIVFVIRANPADSQRQGGYYFSTVGAYALDPEQFGPALLTFVKEHPKKNP